MRAGKFGFDSEKALAVMQKLNPNDLLWFGEMVFELDLPEAMHKWVEERTARQTKP